MEDLGGGTFNSQDLERRQGFSWGGFVDNGEKIFRKSFRQSQRLEGHGDLPAFGNQSESKGPGVTPNKGGL